MATNSMLNRTFKVLALFLCAVTCSAVRLHATTDTITDNADNALLGSQCASGKYKTSSGKCTNCEQGKYEIDGKCKTCPTGTTSAAGSDAASDCKKSKKSSASPQGSGTTNSDSISGSGSSQDSPDIELMLYIVLAILLVSVLIACSLLHVICWRQADSNRSIDKCPRPIINTVAPEMQFSVQKSQNDCDDIEMGQMDGSKVTLPDFQSSETPTKTGEEAPHPPKKAPCRTPLSHPPKKAPPLKPQWHPLPEARLERPVLNHDYGGYNEHSQAGASGYDAGAVNLAYALS